MRALEVQAAIAAFEVHGLAGMEDLELVRLAEHDHADDSMIAELAKRLERAFHENVDQGLTLWEHGINAAA